MTKIDYLTSIITNSVLLFNINHTKISSPQFDDIYLFFSSIFFLVDRKSHQNNHQKIILFFIFLFFRYIFTIVSYLIGVFIFATIVGQVGNVITNRNANRLEFERLLDGAKTYMRHHKVIEFC